MQDDFVALAFALLGAWEYVVLYLAAATIASGVLINFALHAAAPGNTVAGERIVVATLTMTHGLVVSCYAGKKSSKNTAAARQALNAYRKQINRQVSISAQRVRQSAAALNSRVEGVIAAGRALESAQEELDRQLERLDGIEDELYEKVPKEDAFWLTWSKYHQASGNYQRIRREHSQRGESRHAPAASSSSRETPVQALHHDELRLAHRAGLRRRPGLGQRPTPPSERTLSVD